MQIEIDHSGSDKGIAMVTTLLLTLLLSILVGAMLSSSTSDVVITGNDIRTNQSFYIAEAGIHRAAGWFTAKFGADPNSGLFVLPEQNASNTAGVAGKLSFTDPPYYQKGASASSSEQLLASSVKVLSGGVLQNLVLAGDGSNTYPASYSVTANDLAGNPTTFNYSQVVSDFSGKLSNQTEGEGQFSVKATLVSITVPNGAIQGTVTWLLESTGTITRGTTTIASSTMWAYISATTRPILLTTSTNGGTTQTDVGSGIIAKGMITVTGGGTIDSYKSSLGAYLGSLSASSYPGQIGSQNRGSKGNLRTDDENIGGHVGYINMQNGIITGAGYATSAAPSGGSQDPVAIDTTGKVHDGETSPWPNSNLGAAFVASNKHYGQSPLTFPDVPDATPPVTGSPNYTWNTSGSGTLPSGNYNNVTVSQGSLTVPPGNYGTVNISGSSKLYLGTPGQKTVYNLQGLTTSGGSQIIFKGPVTFYIENSLTMSGSSGLNDPSIKPSDLHWNFKGGSGQKVTLSGGGNTYGIFYAPNNEMDVSGSGDFYGSFAGQTITVSGGGAIHADEDAGSGVTTTTTGTTTTTTVIGYTAANYSLWRITQEID